MNIILYEDTAVLGLSPITLVRPAFDIRTAGYTLLETVKLTWAKADISAHSRKLVHETAHIPEFVLSPKDHGAVLFLNARLAPDLSALTELAGILRRSNEDCALYVNDAMVGFFTASLVTDTETIETLIERYAQASVRHDMLWPLFNHPEEVIFFNRDELGENLKIATKSMRSKKRGLYVGKGTVLPKQFAYDVTHGPIVIGEHVTIAPFVVLKGPLFIGESSIIKEFTVIEGGTTIGPVCKVGGEIAGSVIDGYSNKQHVGSLLDSYVGRWVNIAGGTFTADLKNTYSHVSIGGRDSGAQFLGSVFGDYAKTSINTCVFPGRLIGVCAHLYGTVAEDVPSFTSHVRSGVMYELPVGLAEKGQKAMAMRRGVLFTEADTARMVHVFDHTAKEREEANVSKEKISFY